MFYDMHEDTIASNVGIACFHSVAIFLDKSVCSFDPCSEGFQSLINNGVR